MTVRVTMEENSVYDIPISEAAKILDKSDRQVRRYVKEGRLKAKTIRIDGHMRLMFNRNELNLFREGLNPPTNEPNESPSAISGELMDDELDINEEIQELVPESGTNDGNADAIKYAIEVLREQIDVLRQENKELHQQLEQHSGLIGFWQGKAEILQEELKALTPASNQQEDPKPARSWWKRLWGIE